MNFFDQSGGSALIYAAASGMSQAPSRRNIQEVIFQNKDILKIAKEDPEIKKVVDKSTFTELDTAVSKGEKLDDPKTLQPNLKITSDNLISEEKAQQKRLKESGTKFKLFINNQDMSLTYIRNDGIIQEDLRSAKYITLKTSYRANSYELTVARSSLTWLGLFRWLARMRDNEIDNCGLLGFDCLYLEPCLEKFNKITTDLISKGFVPVGTATLANEQMIQSYIKKEFMNNCGPPAYQEIQSQHVQLSGSTQGATAAGSSIKKRIKSKRKSKRGSKRVNRIK